MSADNWASCPRCKDNKVDEVADLEKQVEEAYGKVSAEEFMQLNGALAQARLEADKDDWNDRTFREDYEIYGADEGVVKVSYSGFCTKCYLKLNFEEERPFYPEVSAADRAEHLAQEFHRHYEHLAPVYGYKTREESAKPWDEVPENNRNLMTAVCAEILKSLH